LAKVLEVIQERAALLGLHHHVIHISVHVSPNLPLQASLHGPLVSGSSILRAKRHSDITIGSIWGDEGGLDLIRLEERDLVIA
jgi:hypothetical protein